MNPPEAPASHISERGRRLAFLASAGAVGLAALFARVAGAAQAFAGRELVTLDGDSLYHLRRMRLMADAFPSVPWIDPAIAWPTGGPVPWAAGFDFMGALAILVGRAVGSELGADLWVAALCPLLGVAVVVATMELVYTLARGLPGKRPATLCAGILAAAIPQGLAVSRFGRIDHHVAEALAMVLLARWSLVSLPPRPESPPHRRIAYELGGAALTTWALSIFTGSPLYVALVFPVLLAAVLLAPRARVLGSGGPGLLAGAAAAALLSAPAVAAHGRALAFGFLSWLQPLLLAAAGAALCGAALLSSRMKPGARRAAVVLVTPLVIATVAALAYPTGAIQAGAAIREWLFKSDPWLASIDEFQPLLFGPDGPVFGVNRFLGVAGFAAPLAIAIGAAAVLRLSRARGLAFLWLTTSLALLTLLQCRFGRVFVPFLAASGGLALALGAGYAARWSRFAGALPVVAALGLAVLDPRVRGSLGLDTDPVPDASIEAAFDLRQREPGPSPGVLAPWDLGNAFLVISDRPVVATGFGPYPDPDAYYESILAFTWRERELLPWLEKRRVGWVVCGAANFFGRVPGRTAAIPFSGRALSQEWMSEVASSPLLLGGTGLPSLGVPHFEHLEPVFASTRTVRGIDGALPVLWTYQVVAGARIHGRSPAGIRVVLEIPLEEHGRVHPWRAFTTAGPDGRWELTIPLSTDLAGAISTGPGRLLAGSAPPRPVSIPQTAVHAGLEVEVP